MSAAWPGCSRILRNPHPLSSDWRDESGLQPSKLDGIFPALPYLLSLVSGVGYLAHIGPRGGFGIGLYWKLSSMSVPVPFNTTPYVYGGWHPPSTAASIDSIINAGPRYPEVELVGESNTWRGRPPPST